MRRYQETHSWINFQLNLQLFSHKIWLLLGEAESKCSHVAGVPLRPEVARELNMIYLSKGAHGTASIEGNTLSEDEVLARVEGELPLPPSREYLGREIDNIVAACNEIVQDVLQGRPLELTAARLAHFNKKILDGLPVDEDTRPGEIREHSVGVARYRGAPAEDCEFLLNKLCSWLNEVGDLCQGELAYTGAVLKAVLAHLYIAWIHPFGDGNGRTARLMEFQLMIQAGVPLPAAHLLSDHYNRTRDMYYRELALTSRGTFPIDGFVFYALQGFVDELREQLTRIREEQMEVTWQNWVHDQFRGQETPAKRRQKHLVLDLPRGQYVPVARVRGVSPRVAEEYAGRTNKAITRDLNALEALGLIRRTRTTVIANRDIVKAFLPVRAEQLPGTDSAAS